MNNPEVLYYEDMNIGDEWISSSRTVTEADIVNFAGLSGDFNQLHMDEEFAKKTTFGKRIAHGLLGLCIASGFSTRHPPTAIIAFLGIKEWNFKAPIFIGDTITLRNKIIEKKLTSKGNRGIVTFQKTVINQSGEAVQEGKTTLMIALKQNKSDKKSGN
ncbi:MAG TPA: MaoC/PaaZ C-terminal domain-containing protein [bacterium]